MLVIRLQRVGRKGHAQFRVVVQDSRRTPTSGRVVANLGHYDPHTKETTINKEKAQLYLNNGAQPSNRVVSLFISQGIKLPKWVVLPVKQSAKTRNPEKLRRNQPKETETTTTKETEETPKENTESEKNEEVTVDA